MLNNEAIKAQIVRDIDDLMILATNASLWEPPYILVSKNDSSVALRLTVENGDTITGAEAVTLWHATQMRREWAQKAAGALYVAGVEGWAPLPVREAVAAHLPKVLDFAKNFI